jgi:hypothetical protein
MKKYMLTFFGGNKALRYDNLDKAEKEAREKHVTAWAEWMSKLMKAEQLEVGYPLESDGKRIDSDGTQDYHFPDSTEGGFIVIKAESLDQAAAIAGSSPILKNGGYILARPCGEMR